MRIMTLNIWGGRVKSLLPFVEQYSQSVDVFCFQEVFNNPSHVKSAIQTGIKQDIYSDLCSVLADFRGYLSVPQDDEESLAMFIKKKFVVTVNEEFVYRGKNTMQNNDPSTSGITLQHAQFKSPISLLIANFHGHWCPQGKGDNAVRIEQSNNIQRILNQFSERKVLCGDFNLLPNANSLKLFEQTMTNLITENGITSTRSSFYKKEGKFADYIFVSPSLPVKQFCVLSEVVSDHLPLLLEIEI